MRKYPIDFIVIISFLYNSLSNMQELLSFYREGHGFCLFSYSYGLSTSYDSNFTRYCL